MYQIDFSKPEKVHFIGIGGISMSGIAELLLKEAHYQVSGSDAKPSPITKQLEEAGAMVYYGQRRSNITDDVTCVVFTAAIHPDNPEYDECVKRGLPMLTRAEILGQIMAHYKNAIGIAGTHGKTTTTSMVSTILLEAQTDPTLFIGGILDSISGNMRIGSKDYLVAEACEYTNSFLSLIPTAEIILNIEEDHLDFFKDLADIRHSFARYAALLPSNGILVMNAEIEDPSEITADVACPVVSYGEGGDVYASNVIYNALGYPEFDVCVSDSFRALCEKEGHAITTGHLVLNVPGTHNVSNALAATALCLFYGISFDSIAVSLAHFSGAKRRFERKGEIGGVTIIDDYAHHPTEIKATLAAANRLPHHKVWCVFQPHTYTRTKELFSEFVEALSHADEVVLADIYAARETDTLGMSSALLAEELTKRGVSAHYLPSFDAITNFLLENCIHGDLLITTGAGDVDKIGDLLLGK